MMRSREHFSARGEGKPTCFFRLSSQSVFLGVPLFAMLFLGGCPKKPTHMDLGKNGLIKPPLLVPRVADTTPPVIASETRAWPLPGVFMLSIRQPNPPAIRHTANPTEPEPEPVKSEAPQISPQLSPEERARAQASAQDNMRIAQQNLDAAAGKRLTPDQQDMADKIRGFLKQVQDAIAVSDWGRASNLAEKAMLLSVDLLRSLRT